MPYALFSNAVQISNAFDTKAQVWNHASACGLVIEVSSSEEDPPRRILGNGYTIEACAADTAPGESGLAPLIGRCEINRPSAAAAS